MDKNVTTDQQEKESSSAAIFIFWIVGGAYSIAYFYLSDHSMAPPAETAGELIGGVIGGFLIGSFWWWLWKKGYKGAVIVIWGLMMMGGLIQKLSEKQVAASKPHVTLREAMANSCAVACTKHTMAVKDGPSSPIKSFTEDDVGALCTCACQKTVTALTGEQLEAAIRVTSKQEIDPAVKTLMQANTQSCYSEIVQKKRDGIGK